MLSVEQKKLIEQADKALVGALMELIEVGARAHIGLDSKAQEEAIWRSICHARNLIKDFKED